MVYNPSCLFSETTSKQSGRKALSTRETTTTVTHSAIATSKPTNKIKATSTEASASTAIHTAPRWLQRQNLMIDKTLDYLAMKEIATTNFFSDDDEDFV